MNTVMIVILVVFLAERAFFYLTDILNLRYLRRNPEVPEDFRDTIDAGTYEKTRSYTADRTVFSCIENLFDDIVMAVFLFGGILNWYNTLVSGWKLDFILSGVLFFLVLLTVQSFIKIPFDLFNTFGIEKRYGFNKMKGGLWVSDFIKSLVLQTLLFGVLALAALWLVKLLPGWWWLALWAFYFLFNLFMMVLSPTVIEPMFNKYTPLEDSELEGSIKTLLEKTGIRVERVFKMDASKRSTHSNAYFSGIGRVKRIVLFDTLLEKFTREEILAVLAHEAGHWKKKHVTKRLIATAVISLAVFFAIWAAVRLNVLSAWFGVSSPTFLSEIFVAGFLLGLASFAFGPVATWFSRRDEREADRFAVELTGNGENMVNALKKLVKENLSNLNPHPWMVFFRYSHPPVRDRITAIRKTGEK